MLKVLIAEDNVLFSKSLKTALEQYGCSVVGIATSVADGISQYNQHQPDLVLIDIELDEGSIGIELAKHINKTKPVPFIYLTDHFGSDSKYYKPATATRPANYLPKSHFLPSHLWHFVETALTNFAHSQGQEAPDDNKSACFIRNQYFIKGRNNSQWHRITAADIVYINVNRPYGEVHTLSHAHSFFIRGSLSYLLQQFDAVDLIRIHKATAVNINSIATYDSALEKIFLTDGTTLEVGRTFKKELQGRVAFLQ
jgi:DNA-binding LytR/AlgR family response regulator